MGATSICNWNRESLTEVKGYMKNYHATSYNETTIVFPGFGIRALAILRPQ